MNKIFVYGTLQRGMYNDKWIDNDHIEKIEKATIKGDLYTVLGVTYPALVNCNTLSDKVVHGELYTIKKEYFDKVINDCDYLEGEGHLYKRVITLATNENNVKSKAYTYEFIRVNNLGTRITSGDYKSCINKY